jgi:signal transduction histidine kinase
VTVSSSSEVVNFGDEKKNRFFAFDLDGNNNLVHPLSSGWEGGFSISTGMSIL